MAKKRGKSIQIFDCVFSVKLYGTFFSLSACYFSINDLMPNPYFYSFLSFAVIFVSSFCYQTCAQLNHWSYLVNFEKTLFLPILSSLSSFAVSFALWSFFSNLFKDLMSSLTFFCFQLQTHLIVRMLINWARQIW